LPLVGNGNLRESNGRSALTRSRDRDEENYDDMLKRYQDDKQRKEKEKERERERMREERREWEKEREKERDRMESERADNVGNNDGQGTTENAAAVGQDSEKQENQRVRKGEDVSFLYPSLEHYLIASLQRDEGGACKTIPGIEDFLLLVVRAGPGSALGLVLG